MYGIYWTSTEKLDTDQMRAVKGMERDSDYLILGPAGSGKTNILILRAKWLLVKKLSEIRIIAFTRDLRDFIKIGCEQYGVPPENVLTSVRLFRDFLDERNVIYHLTSDFEADRLMLAGKVQSLIDELKIQPQFDALLIDESQDYNDTEILIFRKLSDRLILAADSRQSIYKITHSPGLLEKTVGDNIINLELHYRSGLKICKVADSILRDSANFTPLQSQNRYPEGSMPSSVNMVSCSSFDEQVESILEKLSDQLDLYPGELLGVIFPKREQVRQFQEALEQNSSILERERIKVETMHSAKGLEFRAVHIGGCEQLYKMGGTQKRLAYTSILRAKTAATVYFSGKIPGYLESAIAKISPPVEDPTDDELFSR